MNQRYHRTTKRELIDANRKYNTSGCNTYSIYNIGNTIVTIDGILPLLPKEQFEGPNEHPDIFDYSDIDIQFAEFPYSGFASTTANKDNRVIITKSYVTKAN